MQSSFWVVVWKRNIAERAHRLRQGSQTVGRSTECEVHLNDPAVSRRHAEMTVTPGRVMLRDLGSRFGTYVDEDRVVEAWLNVGMRLRFGQTILELVDSRRFQEILNAEDEEGSDITSPLNGAGMTSATGA